MIIGPCTVVTGGATPMVLEDGGVHVSGAHIAHVAHVGTLAAAYPDEELWQAQGQVLLPGFVNTHAHLARHLARGRSLAGTGAWRRYERALSPEDIYWAAMAALVEGVRHGVSTVFDFHRSGACIELSLSEIVSAASDIGVRVGTCYGVAEDDSPDERRAALEETLGFADEIRGRRQGTLRGLLGVQASNVESVDRLLREALDGFAEAVGVHVDLQPQHGAFAENAALWFGNPVPALWAHAEAAPASLLGLARERGDALSLVEPDARRGGGADGVSHAGWGSDGGLNAPPMSDATHDASADGDALYGRLLVHGARWGERYFGEGFGSVTAGAPADLVLVDYRPATELSPRTLAAHLASGLLRAPVTGMMVAGEVVMDGGRLVKVDEREVAARARECAARVWERLS